MKNILKIEKLSIGYEDKVILKGINLDIAEGEFLGIIGPNGTGKSTLIKAITDTIDIKEGKITIRGSDNREISKRERARLVAVVPQEFSVDFEFSVLDIVMMGRNPHMYGKRPEKDTELDIVQDAMMMTNTWQIRYRLFNELSGGEKQRVIIARAIAQQTGIILLDEPTSHLDIHKQLEVLELVRRLQAKKNLTIIAVLHDINMAARFSDRIIILNDGKILADGKPEEVIKEKYLSSVYQMEMIVRENKILSAREIVPLRVMKEKCRMQKIKVHAICGGGSGEQILERIYSLGAEVTCGVLNRGDSDWELCRMLGIKCIDVPPFSDISDKEKSENGIKIESADVILVSDVQFGHGNIKNLENLLDTEKTIYMKRGQSQNDFTGGLASSILNKLENKGNFRYIDSYDEFIDIFSEEKQECGRNAERVYAGLHREWQREDYSGSGTVIEGSLRREKSLLCSVCQRYGLQRIERGEISPGVHNKAVR
jgi:iron complex transport system ATP-binding protein